MHAPEERAAADDGVRRPGAPAVCSNLDDQVRVGVGLLLTGRIRDSLECLLDALPKSRTCVGTLSSRAEIMVQIASAFMALGGQRDLQLAQCYLEQTMVLLDAVADAHLTQYALVAPTYRQCAVQWCRVSVLLERSGAGVPRSAAAGFVERHSQRLLGAMLSVVAAGASRSRRAWLPHPVLRGQHASCGAAP